MQVLYISQKPAYPIIDGGSFAINRFLKDVRETIHGEIDYLAITTVKHPMDSDAAQQNLGDNITIYAVEVNTKSVNGAWKITTGAGAEVVAIGNFT